MNKNRSVNRRQFIGGGLGAASALGYSLMVNAEELIHFDRDTRDLDNIRDTMDAVSPPGIEERIAGEPHMRVVPLDCDFCVAGGGMAGVVAALSAARHGAKVVLVQDRSRLGGNGSSEIRMHIVGADMSGGRAGWREGGILEELRLEYMAHNPHQAWEMWDFLLYDKLVSEPGVTLLLDTAVCGAQVKDGQIMEALARCDKTEHLYRIKAKNFADCTGDCRLALEAGAAVRTGHEAQATFDEPLAPETAGEDTLGSSILFTSKDQGEPVPFTPPAWARKIRKEDLKHRGTGSWEFGYWWIEWGGMLDIIKDDDRIREELLKVLMGVWDHLKNHGDHGAENWALDWFGFLPARRESRRLMGAYVLRQDDLTSGRVFDDEVAYGGWPIDNHYPGGIDHKGKDFWFSEKLDDVYSIPLRSLYSNTLKNLFFGGRCLSATHIAMASTRVMATCAVIGQGIGTAAAHCAATGRMPGDLGKQDIETVKQTLLREDAFLAGTPNRDPDDIARGAAVSAGSELPTFAARKVTDGVTRGRHGDSHQWRSKSLKPEDAWIALDFGRTVGLSRVQLTFDTGLSRNMTLSHEDSFNAGMEEGPQPETVKDYRLEARVDGAWRVVREVAGNYQRRRAHEFDGLNADGLRLTASATHGVMRAHLFEIRAYS